MQMRTLGQPEVREHLRISDRFKRTGLAVRHLLSTGSPPKSCRVRLQTQITGSEIGKQTHMHKADWFSRMWLTVQLCRKRDFKDGWLPGCLTPHTETEEKWIRTLNAKGKTRNVLGGKQKATLTAWETHTFRRLDAIHKNHARMKLKELKKITAFCVQKTC